MATPVVAFVVVLVAVLAYPGFDHAHQYLSDLGSAKAPHPQIFNLGILLAGLGAAAGGLGFGLALNALGSARLPAVVTTAAFGLAGFGLVAAGLYPSPDPRHLAINFALGIQVAPLCLVWGLVKVEGVADLRRFLIAVFAAMVLLTLITKSLIFKGLVGDGNVGWWERGFAVVLVGWTGVAAWALERRLARLEASNFSNS